MIQNVSGLKGKTLEEKRKMIEIEVLFNWRYRLTFWLITKSFYISPKLTENLIDWFHDQLRNNMDKYIKITRV